jgi:dTMP kinase
MSQGFFITFEGLDGSGKSTQLACLEAWLQKKGFAVTVTRQPGGTHIGDAIRAVLLDSRTAGLSPLAELGLMFSDRAQSIAEVIRPALDRGDVVLCDRFTDSTEAYQGGGRELGSAVVLDLHARLCGGVQPELTLLLLPNHRMALERARERNARAAGAAGGDENRFEKETAAFYGRVLGKYREIAAREPARIVSIEGEGSIQEIRQQIAAVVEGRLRNAQVEPSRSRSN